MSPPRKTLLLLFIFSVAMGFLETAVVVYLREIYYPSGFRFPLVPIPGPMALVEVLREAATVVMLVAIGWLAGKSTAQRFCYFLFCFAVWDIFYYVFLKLLLGWPESLFTFDILFLIPVPWTGPVLAPCLASLTMILLTVIVDYYLEKNIPVRFRPLEWWLLTCGAVVMIASFVRDYFIYATHHVSESASAEANGRNLFDDFSRYIPQSYSWPLFIIGEAMILATIVLLIRRLNRVGRLRPV